MIVKKKIAANDIYF